MIASDEKIELFPKDLMSRIRFSSKKEQGRTQHSTGVPSFSGAKMPVPLARCHFILKVELESRVMLRCVSPNLISTVAKFRK